MVEHGRIQVARKPWAAACTQGVSSLNDFLSRYPGVEGEKQTKHNLNFLLLKYLDYILKSR